MCDHQNYMAYPNKLNSEMSQDLYQLRDSTVNSSRILYLSRYVRHLKNKNAAFPFTHNPYNFIVNPNNYSIAIGLLQFVQNSSFFVSYLQENPEIIATIVFSIRKQWQYAYLINCIIPSLYGYFACHEYTEYALSFYSEIIKKTEPKACIQIIKPFLHSCVTYHFFDNAYSSFIYSVLVDKNILKNPDTYVTVFADLLIECIKESIKFLPHEFFKLTALIQRKNWSFESIKSLIVDHFLIPELKIWSSRLDINPELKNFIYRIIDMISLSLSQDSDLDEEFESSFSSFSCSMNFEPSIYSTDSGSSNNLFSLSLGFDLPAQPAMTISRSTSTFRPSKRKSLKMTDQSRNLMINMKILINSFFIDPSQNISIYEMINLYENFSDEIFPQCTHFALSIYDIQFLAKTLEKMRKFPPKVSSSAFISDSVAPFIDGIFYCHVYSHHITKLENQQFVSLFNKENIIHMNEENDSKKVKFNISLIENNLFVKFLKFNDHYRELFESYMIESNKTAKTEQNENIERIIAYRTLMNEIQKQNDKVLNHSSYFLEGFTNQIIDEVKSQQNLLKTQSFIKTFKKISKVFNASNLMHLKKILYLKLLNLFYKDLIGHYWHVLTDFEKFWHELVHKPEDKKNLISYVTTKFCFLPYFVNSTELLSQLDNQPLNVKYFIMIHAFTMLSHISKKIHNTSEVFEMLFQKIKSHEFISAFLVIDSMAMRVEVFQGFCTEDEIRCWNDMKTTIDTFIKQDEKFNRVYKSVTEYLSAISPSVLYNTHE